MELSSKKNIAVDAPYWAWIKKLHIDDEFKIGGVEVSFSALGAVLAGQQFNNDSYGTFTKITIDGTEKYIKLYDSLSSV